MTVEEYAVKVEELIKASSDKILGAKIGKTSNVKMVVISINNNPTLVLCTVNENHEPEQVLFCMELEDIDSAKLLQIWAQEITNVHSQNLLFQTEVEKL